MIRCREPVPSAEALIKPAVQDAGLGCIRGDEIQNAGRQNPNALHEPGVRHAHRPYTIIVIAGEQLNTPEIGGLTADLLTPEPLLSYVRYNIECTRRGVDPLMPRFSEEQIESLAAMDKAENLEVLQEPGGIAAGVQVLPRHFPDAFDLAD